MIVGRTELQRREDAELAAYALRAAGSGGRRYTEPDDPYRTAFQRDRDRVIHCSAYRRLGNKTQVFISFEGEHYRTRLTHTEEATQIAVSVARALAANVDLTEAISRAHDLGHAPFGHAGEDALAAKMAGHGGFEHNLQTLRVVEDLELEYPDFPGLNLTVEVREGVMAHRADTSAMGHASLPTDTMGTVGGDGEGEAWGKELRPSVEAQIADVSDEIAYSCHDLQDGLASGLLRRDDLVRERPSWWVEAAAALSRRWGALEGAARSGDPVARDLERRRVKGYLINRFVTDLIESSAARLAAAAPSDPAAVRRLPARMIDLSPPMRVMRESLHAYLMARLYRHYEVVTMSEKAQRLLGSLFDAYLTNQSQLPDAVRGRIQSGVPLERAICDHIASMTDRGAVREYHRLYDMDAQVLP
jgi:dGTPase